MKIWCQRFEVKCAVMDRGFFSKVSYFWNRDLAFDWNRGPTPADTPSALYRFQPTNLGVRYRTF